MSKNVVLTDANGEQILPVTTSENVYTGAGVTLKETLKNLSGGGGAIIVDTELSEESDNPVENRVITAKINEVFQSVSNGKRLIAGAITDGGVSTDATASFNVMATNINLLRNLQGLTVVSGINTEYVGQAVTTFYSCTKEVN